MSQTSLTVRTPGKLMVAGEFSVLVPNQRIVVMAVNRFVYTTIELNATNQLTLKNFNLYRLPWEYTGENVLIHSERKEKNYVENAMTAAYTYLKENDVHPEPFHLTVNSELDDASGVKYGLGSSAAVVTSVITAILKHFLPTEPSKTLIYKLASITHVKTQGNGSGADVAASTFGGVLAYTSFQAEWLKEAIDATNTFTELVEKNWIYWSTQSVEIPDSVHICIGWTGTPASTSQLVSQVLALKETDPDAFEFFLERSNEAVHTFLYGAKHRDVAGLIRGVKLNRVALTKVGHAAGTEIETPLLRTLSDLAEQHGGAGKPSGAGGGDCGMAFLPSKKQGALLHDAWEKEGIKPLDLTVASHGSREMV